METPPLATTNDYTGYPPPPSPPSDLVMECFNDMNEVTNDGDSSDRTTLLSSVGALFQYISPRASFDRDSAIGSDIEEEEEEFYGYEEDEAINHDSSDNERSVMASSSNSNPKKKRNPSSSHPIQSMNNPPPGVAAANVTNPMNDPNMLYRRRQSQIYDIATPQPFAMQKKRRQSLPNLITAPSSSLEKDRMLLQTLPGSRRVDFALQPGPMLGGMISNQYLLGLQAHFSYWNNKDMLWRMVSQLDKAIH